MNGTQYVLCEAGKDIVVPMCVLCCVWVFHWRRWCAADDCLKQGIICCAIFKCKVWWSKRRKNEKEKKIATAKSKDEIKKEIISRFCCAVYCGELKIGQPKDRKKRKKNNIQFSTMKWKANNSNNNTTSRTSRSLSRAVDQITKAPNNKNNNDSNEKWIICVIAFVMWLVVVSPVYLHSSSPTAQVKMCALKVIDNFCLF